MSPGHVQVTRVSLTPDELHDLDLGDAGVGGEVSWLGRHSWSRLRPGAGARMRSLRGLLRSFTGLTGDW